MEKFENFTDEDLEKLRALQSLQKRVVRQRKQILAAIDDDKTLRRQVVDHLKIEDRLSDIAQLYGTDANTLYAFLIDPSQIDAFRKNYMTSFAGDQTSSDADEDVIDDDDSTASSDKSDSYY